MTEAVAEDLTCKYCSKSFKRMSTLSVHLCEPKRRWQQEKDVGVQIGFNAYLKFYESVQSSAKAKTYKDFAESPYYSSFVKFGQNQVSIRGINPKNYTEWLLKNNKKLDQWCKEAFYVEWMMTYIQKENVQDALERSLKEMQNHADSDHKLQDNFNNYFRFSSSNRITTDIADGRISPWVVYNCASGIEYLDGLNEDQIRIVMPWINPDYWQRKFKDYVADVEWIKDILKTAGL